MTVFNLISRRTTALRSLGLLGLLALSHTALRGQQADEPKSKKLSEVVVQGERRPVGTTSVAKKLSSQRIDESMGQSLAAMLEKISGLSSLQTGVGTAKPVIHGMHGNRILIVNNGARQNGQQWGEGHAPELDMSSSQSVYVVKGAESVRYGSEALGGVIVMEQQRLPYGSDAISGKLNLLYGSNGRRFGTNALLEGAALASCRLGYRLQASHSNGGDRYTGDYILNNTGDREYNYALALGYSWDRTRLETFYSRYDAEQGIMLAAKMGNVHELRERIAIGQPLVFTPWSRQIDYPREHVVHHNLTARLEHETASWGQLRYQFTYQDDHRKEYRIRRNNNSHIPEVDLRLQSQQHQLRWTHTHNAWYGESGALWQHINNYSIAGNGITPIIPNYVEDSWGAYALGRYQADRWSAELGLRLDGQRTAAAGYDIAGNYYGGERRFTNFTYSLGGHRLLAPGLTLRSNLGVAWRAPHVHELYSNGSDHGSAAFVRGDSLLRSEQSYKWITSLNYARSRLRLSLDGYLQWVHNYIYDSPEMRADGTPELIVVLSGAYPVFQFRQTNAFLRGLDFEGSYEFNKYLSYELRTALIFANELRTGAYLPYIPPVRVDHALAFRLPSAGHRPELRLELGHRYVSKQTRFDPNKDLTSDTPPAYHLLNAELSAVWRLRRYGKELSLRLIGDNLLNKHYKEYTNRARYYSHDLGRDLRIMLGYKF